MARNPTENESESTVTISASSFSSLIDVESSVVLRNVADGAETSTSTETSVPLNALDGAYWNDQKAVPYAGIEIVVAIPSCSGAEGDETYVLSLLIDDQADMANNPTTVWSAPIVRGFRGSFKVVLDSETLSALDTEFSGADKFLAIKATLGGTMPAITYGASIVKSI